MVRTAMTLSVFMVMGSRRMDEVCIRLSTGRPVLSSRLPSVINGPSLCLGGHDSQYLYSEGRLGLQAFGKCRDYLS